MTEEEKLRAQFDDLLDLLSRTFPELDEEIGNILWDERCDSCHCRVRRGYVCAGCYT